MALTLIGTIAAITDAVAASLVSGATATRDAVDGRVRTVVNADLSQSTAMRDAVDGRARSVSDAIIQAGLSNSSAVTQAVQAKINEILAANNLGMVKGSLTSGQDLNNVTTTGVWLVETHPIANSLLNRPTVGILLGAATVHVAATASGGVEQEWRSLLGTKQSPSLQRTRSTGGTWSPWSVTKLAARQLLADQDVNTYRGAEYEGDWEINSSAILTATTNLPAGAGVGVLTVKASTGFQEYRCYTALGAPRVWIRGVNNVGTGEWSDWMEIPTGQRSGITAGDAALGHKVRQDRARARVGGRIGTAGRAVVALRFDDYPDEFESVVLPLLRQYQLPSYFALTVRHVEELSTRTWAQVRAWANDGVQFFGHSWSHSAASGETALRREIVESADYLESKLPGVVLDGWVMPGTGQGADGYDGMGTGDTAAKYIDHPAGRLIMSRYGVVNGGVPGYLAPLVGAPSAGQLHATYETYSLAEAQAVVLNAQQTGTGVSLMLHPANIGKTGYMSLADFQAFLAWIAAERDAERLLVLTGTGLAFADASTSDRMNLLPSMSSLTGWGGTTGWTASGGVFSGTTSAGQLTASMPGQAVNALRGAVVECVALVKAPTGAVVRTGITGGVTKTTDHTLPASNDWKWVRTNVLYPTTAGVSAGLGAAIGRVSGGTVQMRALALQPV